MAIGIIQYEYNKHTYNNMKANSSYLLKPPTTLQKEENLLKWPYKFLRSYQIVLK